MSLAIHEYSNYFVRKQFIEKNGSKSMGGKPITKIDIQKDIVSISKYGNVVDTKLSELISDSYGCGGELMEAIVSAAKAEVENTKTLEDSTRADVFANARSVLSEIKEDELSDEEIFMKRIIDEGYELPLSLIRVFKAETQVKYNKSKFFKVIQNEVGINCKNSGIYIIDVAERVGSSSSNVSEVVLWTAGVYKRLSENGIKRPSNCRDMAQSVLRRLICIRDENGYERLATLAEQAEYNNKCYCKNIASLSKEKSRMLSIVAWLMTGDESMYRSGNLEDTSMRFARQRNDKEITDTEVLYRVNIGYKDMLEALQYISADEFIESDALEIVNSLKKKDEDFLDKEPKVYAEDDWHKDDDSKCVGVSLKDIVKAVAKISPVSEYEKFGKRIATSVNKSKNYFMSEKQREIVVGVYVRLGIEKVELSDEIKRVIEYIMKYRGNRLKNDNIVKKIMLSVERTGKCSEKQYGVLLNEVNSIKDEISRTSMNPAVNRDEQKYRVNDSYGAIDAESKKHSVQTDNAATLFGLWAPDISSSMNSLAHGELTGGTAEDGE